MRGVALNFFPVTTPNFTFVLHCVPPTEDRPNVAGENAVRRRLPVSGEYRDYWTLFQGTDDSKELRCCDSDNRYATLAALRRALLRRCRTSLAEEEFVETEDYRRAVEIRVANFTEGSQVILLEPYFLRARNQFGLLADFRFRARPEYKYSRRRSELSLAITSAGKTNLSHYADRYEQIRRFVDKYHAKLFPLKLPGGDEVQLARRFVELPQTRLEVKRYVVGEGAQSSSQFMGVSDAGPLKLADDGTRLHFIYREQDRPLSRDLYRALHGDLFRTFSGMATMFGLRMSSENVVGTALKSFEKAAIEEVRDTVVAEAAGTNVVPIVLTPFSRQDGPEENSAYWTLKHAFLSAKLPLQVVARSTVADRNTLKWSAAGIGLQVFAKAGGTPWQVVPRRERCLIVGVGQAHRKTSRGTERFFAYSVLTNSSGLLEEVRVLGESTDEESYLNGLTGELRRIFEEYSSRFSSFVVHTTFSIKRRELEAIATTLSDWESNRKEGGDLVCMKFNDRSHFFGYSPTHNSRTPYESTMLPLSRRECLIWFEGLHYGQRTLRKMVGQPVHVAFTYPGGELSREKRRDLLQDAINLSGANWRGFNAKSLPVSVYYAQLIARYLREFDRRGLPEVDVGIVPPWFL